MTKQTTRTGQQKPSPNFSSFLLVLTLVFFFLTLSVSFSVSAVGESIEQEDTVILDEFVRGYFNEISFESDTQTTHIEMTHPEATRTYNWTYDDGWSGDVDFLDDGNTTYDGESWIISIAIYDEEPEGEWNLYIEIDGESNEFDIDVVEPSTSFSASGDISFYLEPYQEDTYSDEESITFTNSGNVRMKVDVNYEDDDLTHEVSQEIFAPGESGDITFQYISSTGGVVEFGETVSIEPYPIGKLDLEIDGNVGVGSRASYGLTIGVTVGYEGYQQAQASNYEVQYLESMEVSGDSHDNLTFYVYPHEEIDFHISSSDVEIIDVSEDTDEPLSPNGEEEIEVTVHFKSHHENDGNITLILNGDRYNSEIRLTETVPQPGEEEVSFIEEEAETITFGIVFIGGILLIGAVRIFISKKKDDD